MSSLLAGPPYCTMNSTEQRISLKCSIQRALLDEVTDDLFAVTCGIDEEKRIHIIAYFDGPVNEEGWDAINTVGGQVIADFPDDYRLEETCLDANRIEPRCLDFWAFRRKRQPVGRPRMHEA